MDNYLKHKDRPPEETVSLIQQILKDAGICPVLRWTGDRRSGLSSNRITIHPSTAGVNGKGTDEIYSKASGFGELMERIQNNFLLAAPISSDTIARPAFNIAPDEGERSLDDILGDPDPFTRRIMSELEGEDRFADGRAYLELFSYERDGKKYVKTIPFADPARGRVVDVPLYMVRRLTGTNGMAAGNTLDEAMVQSLSELFEREVNLMMLEGIFTPPRIPDDAVRQYSFFERIEEIRSDGRYDAELLDCSMGKGWPVVALLIKDLENGTFGLRFGAHPSFPVAIERTLTEAAQGQSLMDFARASRTGTLRETTSSANQNMVTGLGAGAYPHSLFYGEPSWEFAPWTDFRGTTNGGFLKEMLRLLSKDGYEPLVRDSSFLGFPACCIVIPGFRTLIPVDGGEVRLRRTFLRASQSADHFPDLTDEEAERLLRLLRYHESFFSFSLSNILFGVPLTDVHEYSNERIGAYFALRLEDYSLAARMFSKMTVSGNYADDHSCLSCMKDYAVMRSEGLTHDQAAAVLRSTHVPDAADRAVRDAADPAAAIAALLPKLPCPDCSSCRYRDNGCEYEVRRDIYVKICNSMRKENASQEALLRHLENS